jgi:hypothetical protein
MKDELATRRRRIDLLGEADEFDVAPLLLWLLEAISQKLVKEKIL